MNESKFYDSGRQVITTTYYPATQYKAAKVKAVSSSGLSATVPYYNDDDQTPFDAHARACAKLCKQLQWTGTRIAGQVGKSYVFVNIEKYFEEHIGAHNI